jgi:WD40 repeat protein
MLLCPDFIIFGSCYAEVFKVTPTVSAINTNLFALNISLSDDHSDSFSSLAFKSDGTILASGRYSGLVQLWNPWTGENIISFQEKNIAVDRLLFNADGSILVTVYLDGSVTFWQIATGQKKTAPDDSYVFLTLSPDGSLAAFEHGSDILVWNILAGEEELTLGEFSRPDFSPSVRQAAFSPNGQLLTSGDGAGVTRLWDISTGEELDIFEPNEFYGAVGDLSFSPNGEWLAVTYFRLDSPVQTGPILLLNLTNKEERLFRSGRYPFVFAPNGAWFAYPDAPGVVCIGNLLANNFLFSFVDSTQDAVVRSITFDFSGEVLAINYLDQVQLVDTRIWMVTHTLEGNVYSVAFDPEGKLLALARAESITVMEYE